MNSAQHRKIAEEALGSETIMSRQALGWVITANLRSDWHPLDAKRHFDNAASPDDLCAMWYSGFNTYLTRAVIDSEPFAPRSRVPRSRRSALANFGRASHALADFYAHTNWVELMAERGSLDLQAPLLGTELTPEMLPTGLYSGYFNLRYGLQGCPKVDGHYQPPAGYQACHATLAKDSPTDGHGAETIPSAGVTYYEAAHSLAVSATQRLWDAFLMRLNSAYGGQAQNIAIALAWGQTLQRG